MGILGRFAAALATTVALSASVGMGTAVSTTSDPYSTKINTRTEVTTPTPIRTNTRVDISVEVTANSPETPTGTVTLSLSAEPGASGQSRTAGPADWSRTIQYDGGTAHVTGPAFPKTGDWLVTAVFHPDGNTFRGSRDGWLFEVIAGGVDNPGDDTDDGGLLPDTGGPALLWLLLGVGLVGGGAATVVLARRRRTAPAAAA
jgi:hypothetical protein